MAIIVNGEHIDEALVKQEAEMIRPRDEEVMQD